MIPIEGDRIPKPNNPVEIELQDPIAQLSAEYIGLLRDAHITYQAWKPTEVEAQKVHDTILSIKRAIPEINEVALEKMVFDNPNDVTVARAGRNWIIGGQTPYDSSEFHVLAMNWNNSEFANNRQIAENYYEVTQVEVDFLSRGFTALPPAPTLILNAA